MNRKERRKKKKIGQAKISTNSVAGHATSQAMDQAMATYSAGNLQETLRLCLQLKDDNPAALQLGGIAAFQLKDMAHAIDLLGRFAKLNNNDSEAHYNYGLALQQDGQLKAATKAYLHSIKLNPVKFEAFNNLGRTYSALERNNDAEKAFRKGIEVSPNKPEAFNNLGLLLHREGRYIESEELFRRCLDTAPDQPFVLNNLGNLLKDQGRFEDATEIYRKALERQPDNPEFLKNIGVSLMGEQRYEESLGVFNRVLDSHPDHEGAHSQLANLYLSQGDTTNCEIHLHQVLKNNHKNGRAYFSLMKVKELTGPDDSDLIRLKTLLEDPSLEEDQLAEMNIALSEAYGKLNDDEASFRHLKIGNDLKKKTWPFDLDKERKIFGAIKSIFDQDLIDTVQNSGNKSNKPIFILGMPRSGTTLIEQILSAHSGVFGAGELENLASQIERTAGSNSPFLDKELEWTQEIFNSIGQAYINDINRKGLDGSFDRMCDKMPVNFKYIGIIRTALPAAKIIHCTRNAMDTCFSCYKQNFTKGQLYSNDLKNLGNYYRLYHDLMIHWRTLFPDDILDVSYERMVDDPEGSTRRILDYCGLQWEDDCLEFYDNKRSVRTASALQVRQPIYQSSVNSWKRFESELAPLLEILEGIQS